MSRHRRLPRWLALLGVPFLGGCQIFGVTAGVIGTVLNFALPLALSVGGAVAVYYLTKSD